MSSMGVRGGLGFVPSAPVPPKGQRAEPPLVALTPLLVTRRLDHHPPAVLPLQDRPAGSPGQSGGGPIFDSAPSELEDRPVGNARANPPHKSKAGIIASLLQCCKGNEIRI